MIEVVILKRGDLIAGFRVSGHAGYAEAGSDIVCAGVTSAVQLVANGITECSEAEADVLVEDDLVSVSLKEGADGAVQLLLQAFRLQMEIMSQDYSENVSLSFTEV